MKEKKKVLVVCTTDSMIWNFLIPHIYDLINKGIEVECACSRTGFYFDELEQNFNLKLHEIEFERNPFKWNNIKGYRKLSKLIKMGHYDMIYGHEPVGGAMARLAGKRNRKYVMYIAHGFHFFKNAPIKHWIMYYTFEYILSFMTDSIVTICKEDYFHAKKLHAKNCYYIPGIGVDFSKFEGINKEYCRKKMRRNLGIEKEDFVLISVGELSVRKNHQVLIKAMAKLKNHRIKLLICGEGKLEQELKELSVVNGINDSIMFLGFRKDVPQVLYAADVFVFPSLWEGLGLAGLEALYAELPVIGSNRQGIKDYVIPDKNGYLFEPKDENELSIIIDRLFWDEDLRGRLSENGRDSALSYSINKSREALQKIYKEEGVL